VAREDSCCSCCRRGEMCPGPLLPLPAAASGAFSSSSSDSSPSSMTCAAHTTSISHSVACSKVTRAGCSSYATSRTRHKRAATTYTTSILSIPRGCQLGPRSRAPAGCAPQPPGAASPGCGTCTSSPPHGLAPAVTTPHHNVQTTTSLPTLLPNRHATLRGIRQQ
jgi:hypothetical protein